MRGYGVLDGILVGRTPWGMVNEVLVGLADSTVARYGLCVDHVGTGSDVVETIYT